MAYFKCNGWGLKSDKPSNYDTYKSASTLTEAQFIDWISNGGAKYAISKNEIISFIGKYVILNNADYSLKTTTITYKIADYNHDSTINTIDLISEIGPTWWFRQNVYYVTDKDYFDSGSCRDVLNSTLYNAFSTTVKNKITPMSVIAINKTGTDYGRSTDKVKLLSLTELNVNVETPYDSLVTHMSEGSPYNRIFDYSAHNVPESSRRRRTQNSNAFPIASSQTIGTNAYWTRTISTDLDGTKYYCVVEYNGMIAHGYETNFITGLVHAIRFSCS